MSDTVESVRLTDELGVVKHRLQDSATVYALMLRGEIATPREFEYRQERICKLEKDVDKLRGQLQNCVDHLHKFHRGYGNEHLTTVIERANRTLSETLGT